MEVTSTVNYLNIYHVPELSLEQGRDYTVVIKKVTKGILKSKQCLLDISEFLELHPSIRSPSVLRNLLILTCEVIYLYLSFTKFHFYMPVQHISYHPHFHQTLGLCLKSWLPWSSLHWPGHSSYSMLEETLIFVSIGPGKSAGIYKKKEMKKWYHFNIVCDRCPECRL